MVQAAADTSAVGPDPLRTQDQSGMPSEYDFGGAGSFRGRERPTGRPRVGFILGHPGGLTDSLRSDDNTTGSGGGPLIPVVSRSIRLTR